MTANTVKEPFSIHAMELGPMENFVYLIHDHTSDRAAVVDPAWDVPAILRVAAEKGVQITDILLTHSHFDHINGVKEMLDATDAQLHLLKAEALFWDNYLDLPTLHHGGDEIRLGETLIEALHTPGHTPGSACYRLGDALITGDTLFVYGCGRCDLKGGDPERMFDTLRRLAAHLPPEILIHPGHNYGITPSSRLSEQVEGNPFMHFHDRDAFVEYRMHLHDREEPYTPVKRPEGG